jgi:mRNA interferase RelE/StbE
VKIAFRDSFAKDLKNIKDKTVLKRIKELIEAVELSEALSPMPNLKKLKGHEHYYRLRVGDYRIGIALKSDTLIFVRVLNRKDIYKYFP